jgi:hypothetical protein
MFGYLKQKGYHVATPKNFNADSILYPDAFVIVSDDMKDSYSQYGDVIYFDFFEDIIRNHTMDGR